MRETEFWFGPPERSLFARAYAPEGAVARGAVILCPAIGYETPYSRTVYRRLALHLVQRGLAVLRVDYAGTGDSWEGASGAVRVNEWLASIIQAADFAREAGARHVTLVGMHMGATLAAAASQAAAADALVLWGAYPSGRAFLRAQLLMFSVYTGAPARSEGLGLDGPERPERMEILGSVFDRSTVDDILALGAGPISRDTPVLVVGPAGRPIPTKLLADAADVEVATIEDPPDMELLHAASETSGPIFDSIAEWISVRAPSVPASYELPARRSDSAQGPDGQSWEHLARLGPEGLFSIVTQPTGVSAGPVVVMVDSGGGDHLGPGNLHVELARSLATAGVRAVRLDIRGLGDSPPRPHGQASSEYPPEAVADILKAVQSLPGFESPADVVLFGLCSGAYHATMATSAMAARGAIIVNPGFLPPRHFALRALNAAVRRTPSGLRRHLEVVAHTVETWCWARKLARAGSGSLVLCTPDEASTWGRYWARLERTSKKLRYQAVVESDRALILAAGQNTVSAMVRDFVLDDGLQHGAGHVSLRLSPRLKARGEGQSASVHLARRGNGQRWHYH